MDFKEKMTALWMLLRMWQETKTKIGCGNLWIWNGEPDQDWTARVPLGVGLWKFPCVLLVLSGWRRAVIGWNNGDLSVVELSGASSCEVWYMHAHVNAINVLSACRRGQSLLTLAADNYLKLWSVDRLLTASKFLIIVVRAERHAQQPYRGDWSPNF